jgi:hypothetical protein
MSVIVYRPELFPLLGQMEHAAHPVCGLLHRPFVDYYYAQRDWCKLYLAVSEDGILMGTLGVEALEFECEGRLLTICAGSNYYSCRPGGAAVLTRRIIRSAELLGTYGGSDDTHSILRRLKYCSYYPHVQTHFLNFHHLPEPDATGLRAAGKSLLRHTTGRTLAACASGLPATSYDVQVQEEKSITAQMLPQSTPFRFRLSPRLEYLNWRFNTALSFVSYRIFRILGGSRTAGYVVINESPSRVMVSHCDGDDPSVLAYGTLLSLLALGRSNEKLPVVLSCSHPVMMDIYKRFGFVARAGRPFALYSALRPLPDLPDCSTWLVNFEMGDNGLRPPFRDQHAYAGATAGESVGAAATKTAVTEPRP